MLLEMSVKLRRGHLDLTTQLSMSDSSVGCSVNPAPAKARCSA